MAEDIVEPVQIDDIPRPKQLSQMNERDVDNDDMRKLFACSQMSAELTVHWFQSFEGLALLDLHNYQDELAKLNRQVYDRSGGLSNQYSPHLRQEIRTKLRDYCGSPVLLPPTALSLMISRPSIGKFP